nr:MAG TPA: hypothetical protein [Caudoviricetes sp.]
MARANPVGARSASCFWIKQSVQHNAMRQKETKKYRFVFLQIHIFGLGGTSDETTDETQ